VDREQHGSSVAAPFKHRLYLLLPLSAITGDLIYTCWFRKRRPAALTNCPQLASKLFEQETH